jgi:hypothetical protein
MSTLPAHEWFFDEKDGDIAHDWIGEIDATLSYAERASPGYVGIGAIHLSGANNSFVDFSNKVGQFGNTDFTVALWFNTIDAAQLCDIIGNRTDRGYGSWFSIRMNRSGQVGAEICGDASGKDYIGLISGSVNGLNDGSWHHVAVVRQGNSLSLYVDGSLVTAAKAAGAALVSNGNPLKLGRSLIAPEYDRFAPSARFEVVRIYDVALDPGEVSSIIDWPLPQDELRLVLGTDFFKTKNDSEVGLVSGSLTAANGCFVTVNKQNLFLEAKTIDRTQAETFTFRIRNDKLLINAGGAHAHLLKVDNDGIIRATAESEADASPFFLYFVEDGRVVLSTERRELPPKQRKRIAH